MSQVIRLFSISFRPFAQSPRLPRIAGPIAPLALAALLATTALLAARPAGATNTDLYISPGPIDAVNLLSRSYSYDEKCYFTQAVADRIAFFDEALKNWAATPAGAKDEAKAYAKLAQERIRPFVERAKQALDHARSSGARDWPSAQGDSRRTVLEAKRAYSDLHGNSRL
jgi:hypothetical protein